MRGSVPEYMHATPEIAEHNGWIRQPKTQAVTRAAALLQLVELSLPDWEEDTSDRR